LKTYVFGAIAASQWMIRQPSGPKAVAIVSLVPKRSTAQRITSAGVAASRPRLSRANSSRRAADGSAAVTPGGAGAEAVPEAVISNPYKVGQLSEE
jgi:hypothetical protein